MTDTADPRYDVSLLPAADDAPRCADHALAIAIDPVGSALHVDEVMMIDVSLPWPKPVWAVDGFTHIPEAVMAAGDAGRRVRALAAVPIDDGIRRIVAYERVDGLGPMVRHEWHAPEADIPSLADQLLRGGLGAGDHARVDAGAGHREVAICAQGSHDVCCGADGARLVNDLAATRPGLSIRKVSHTGGHRFAPTGLTFPDGRMWGFVSAEKMGRIVDRDGSPSDLADHCRGWVGVEPVGQVAERAVFAAVDNWSVDDVVREVEVRNDADGWVCVVRLGARIFDVVVVVGRAVPTVACRAEGGLPAKPGREYRVASVRER